MCGPPQKIGNVGQVANLPKTRQIDNLPHVGMLHIYCDGPYVPLCPVAVLARLRNRGRCWFSTSFLSGRGRHGFHA